MTIVFPPYAMVTFILTTLLSLFFFYKAANDSKITLLILSGWLIVQGSIASTGFYIETYTLPPRFLLLIGPPLLFIGILFSTARGRKYIDGLNLKTLTLLHVVRIPVEIVLLWLYMAGKVPQLMTFEGRNFDILSGITAPLIWYFGFVTKKISPSLILLWNVICLGLLLNIVVNAVLSAPFAFQQFAFDQPNVAVLFFPFIWLPCVIVPLVLFSHLVAIRKLRTGTIE